MSWKSQSDILADVLNPIRISEKEKADMEYKSKRNKIKEDMSPLIQSFNPYKKSIKENFKKQLSEISDKSNINQFDDKGLTLLHKACLLNDIEAVKFLLLSGAKPNINSKDQDLTPFDMAMYINRDSDIVKLLDEFY